MSALTALLPAADRIARVAVVVPARNEEELISSCLDGLLTAGRELSVRRPEIDIDLIVVADRCTDATEQLVHTACCERWPGRGVRASCRRSCGWPERTRTASCHRIG